MPALTQPVCQSVQKAKINPKDFAKVFEIAGFLRKNPRKWLILTQVLNHGKIWLVKYFPPVGRTFTL